MLVLSLTGFDPFRKSRDPSNLELGLQSRVFCAGVFEMFEAQRLYHISEQSGIDAFEPRLLPSSDSSVLGEVVWAIDEDHLPNYLLPRDCPRVTFKTSERTTSEDRDALLGASTSRRVVAIESAWLKRIRRCRLYVYQLPESDFLLADRSAGYWIARSPMAPINVTEVVDCLAEIGKCGAELRICDRLWPLYDVVVRSTLDYSIIRMRNALPRPEA
jgi:hypothetical protein